MKVTNTKSDSEADFDYSVKMALNNKVSWPTLALMLQDMTPTLKQSRQLVKVLLKELQMLQEKFQNLAKGDMIPSIDDDVCNDNENIEILEVESTVEKFEDCSINETLSDEETHENDDSVKTKTMDFTENLEQFYTFVGSNKNTKTLDSIRYHENENKSYLPETEESLETIKEPIVNTEEIFPVGSEDFIQESFKQTSESNMKHHEKTDSARKQYLCNYCNTSFSRLDTFKRHEKIHTRGKPFQCKQCNKFFATSNEIELHERIHKGEKPFECKICQKKFSKSSELKNHNRTHTGEKPFACEMCNKSFSLQYALTTHKRTHTGEKPYKCKFCKKCFYRSHVLRTHERIHTGEVPYACSECGKRFKGLPHLASHKKIHSNEKPYECSTCGRVFKHSHSWKSHERMHTGEQPFSCTICGKGFTRSTYLKHHITRAHKEKQD